MPLRIPSRLAELLRKNQSLAAGVEGSFADFSEWINNSFLPFFPDYTDHSSSHIEEVLATSSSLIRDEAWEFLTPQDAAALATATLLHDCAMHLSEDAFVALVSGKHTCELLDGDKHRWPILWQRFILEAKNFDGKTLQSMLGSSQSVEEPSLDPERMTKRDRKLIGEFVRRHHPRIAHEIAVFGVPGSPLQLDQRLRDLADLSGLIARSHGMPLRTALAPLERRFDKRNYRGVHSIFLMALLRVGDYLQIQAERAPKAMLQIKRIRSPYSLQEWHAHNAVETVHTEHDDPESVFIRANPQDIKTYLRLKEWLNGIQAEMDQSWAVLGEVFGRINPRLGLTLRRVRSNLDEGSAPPFSEQSRYIPEKIAFSVATGELLKLMVNPLYGDDPSIAIRELLQNSVDAVHELRALQQRMPELAVAPLRPIEGDVEIWIEDPDENGQAYLSITDRGIGMTLEVVQKYLLRVGASYRNSQEWKLAFIDSTNNMPLIVRSGRFGVGLLATFLLNNALDMAIEVETRHVTAEKGLKFISTLGEDPIEVIRENLMPVGTKIRVPLSSEAYEILSVQTSSWDWFCFDDPKVIRKVGDRILRQEAVAPYTRTALPFSWRYLDDPPCKDIFWTFSRRNHLKSVYCNGLKIKDGLSAKQAYVQGITWIRGTHIGNCELLFPNMISVVDDDFKMPLNLARSVLYINDLVDKKIYDSVIEDFLAFLLCMLPEDPDNDGLPFYEGFGFNDLYSEGPFLQTSEGVTLNTIGCCMNLPQAYAVVGIPAKKHKASIVNRPPENICYVQIEGVSEQVSLGIVADKTVYKNKKIGFNVTAAWNRIIGHPVIPYDLAARRSVLKGAYDKLSRFVSCWEPRIKKSQKRKMGS